MQAIKNKISSQRGASLTFALLLFLVCSVVGSVVLTAGTAAAGRMSEISEMDQRYYSINSAAKLLIGLFERDEIRYEKKKAEPAAGDPAGDDATPSDNYSFIIGDKPASASTLALDTAKRVINKQFDTSVMLELTLIGEELSDADLTVSITETIRPTGDVSFLLVNQLDSTEASTTDDQYAVRLTFMNVGTTGTFKWKLTDIESIRSQPAENGG